MLMDQIARTWNLVQSSWSDLKYYLNHYANWDGRLWQKIMTDKLLVRVAINLLHSYNFPQYC